MVVVSHSGSLVRLEGSTVNKVAQVPDTSRKGMSNTLGYSYTRRRHGCKRIPYTTEHYRS